MFRLLLIILLILQLSSLCFSQSNAGCADSSYRKLYYTSTDTLVTQSQINASDGGTFLVGNYKHLNTTIAEGNIVRLDDTGRVSWTLQLKSSQANENLFLERGLEFSNLQFIGAGTTTLNSSDSKLFVAKINPSGGLVWQRSYNVRASYLQQGKVYVSSLAEGLNNEIYVACNIASTMFGNTFAIIKLDASGIVLWQKLFVPDVNTSHLEVAGIHFAGDPMITGYLTSTNGLCMEDQRSVFVAKLDNLTGGITNQRNYCFSKPPAPYPFTDGVYTFNSQLLDDGKLVLSGSLLEGTTFSNTSKRTFLTIRFSQSLDVLSSRTFETSFNVNHGGNRIAARPNGDVMISLLRSSTGVYFSVIDSQNIIIKQRRLPLPIYSYNASVAGNLNYSRILNSKGASTTFANSYTSANKSVLELFKLADADGNALSCSGEDTNFVSVSNFPLLNSSLAWTQIIPDYFIDNISFISSTSLPIISEEICRRITTCDSIRISGKDTVCVLGQEEIYIAHRNPGCFKPIKWNLDSSAFSSFVIVNDTTVRVRFKMPAPGAQKVILSASILGCTLKSDSFVVMLHQVLQARSSANKICPGDTIRISAGYWFKSYLWQDGSTDSVFLADKPGRYFVRVRAHCGYTMSDTIVIGGLAPMSNYLLGRSLRCNNDTLELNAIGGFGNYQWTPTTELSLMNDSTAFVFPSTQTTYKVKIDVFPGCQIADSITIRKDVSPFLNLISDTSICENDSILLLAANGFNSYKWSTGDTTQFLNVKTTGLYTIEAIFLNGCISRDTFNLRSLYTNPAPVLKKTPILCIGQTDSLDGGMFSSYLWSNGASSRSIKISSPGTYWLEVSDVNGCKGSDTVNVSLLVDPPTKFLPADSAICFAQKTFIKPLRSYRNYLWSDGSKGNSLQVSKKGSYSLLVVDQNGCVGTDTIEILEKACSSKIYFPNAFTPDGNGRNDRFKPTVQGQLLKYELLVFNRWGQVVFRTTSHLDGWDGNLSGKIQSAGTYVWSCRYTFSGGEEQVQHGTLILIR